MWFSEKLYDDIAQSVRVDTLYKCKTPYQNLKICKSPRLGNMLILDDIIQTTEKDEFIYHEMLVHPSLFLHPEPKKILVIGAGDGGVIREVLKYSVDEVHLVEIDAAVIEASKKYLPSLSSGAFKDKRVRIIIDDGAKFIKESSDKYDVVILDSPDPVNVAKILFTKQFYYDIFSILNDKGIFVRQTGTTMFQQNELKQNYKIIKNIFPFIIVQLAAVPTYIGGFFSFLIASKKINIERISPKVIENKYKALNLKTKYYNNEIHFASTKLPNYIKEMLK